DWRPDWRVQLIPGYKVHRVAEPVPPALIPQIPVIIAALTAVGVDVIGLDDYEAEDIIASLIPKVEGPVEIWSGDHDLFSQVRDRDGGRRGDSQAIRCRFVAGAAHDRAQGPYKKLTGPCR